MIIEKNVLAIGAHPDDIEFSMFGTLLLLKQHGWLVHCINIADGCLGDSNRAPEEAAACRKMEAQQSAKLCGFTLHESFCHDLEIFYDRDSLAKLIAVIRKISPRIILTHGSWDYMEDHINAGRLSISAAFCRNMPHVFCDPPVPCTNQDVAIYHSMPHSITDQYCRKVIPDIFVDITSCIEMKRQALACHASQSQWLETSQKDDYVSGMDMRSRHWGEMAGVDFAEGWILHNPIGFAEKSFNPLYDTLRDFIRLRNSSAEFPFEVY